jgi:uncharacterized membrane protein YphA (DoxX/SURF4 family)
MRVLTIVSRVLVGALFIFSGFIKANDTLGFSYKLVEYFEVFGTEFMIPLATPLAMFICIFEVALGFTLLMGSRLKLTLWLLLLMIVFFTFLTFYSAYFNKVTSCGCFGDAIPLTPWQSFSKDLILLVFIIILFIGQKHITPLFSGNMENVLLVLILIASTAFPIYTYNYLPIIDFRPYAVGKNIPEQTKGVPDELKYFYILKDKQTGKEEEFDKWPDGWDTKYDYVNSRTEIIKKGIEPKIKDFSVLNLDGADYTQDIIENPNYNFLLVCYDLDKVEKSSFGQINDFAALCKQNKVALSVLTASSKEDIARFKTEINGVNLDFYNSDGTVLKTMIRSNPGLMLLKAGTVQAMWHYHSLPAFDDIQRNFLSKK